MDFSGLLNPTDIVFGIFIVVLAIKGAFKGLINEAFGLAALALGIYFADTFNAQLGTLVVRYMGATRVTANILSFLFIFFVVYTVIFLVGVLITAGMKKIDLGFMNRMFGMLFGAAKAFAVIVVVALIFNTVSFLKPYAKNMKEHSKIYYFTDKIIQTTNLVEKINEAMRKR